ncbi:MAG: LPS assembly lipoprotein LptE [Hyphomonadaceae bacterium]|nr:LPS assembly lipoprotein LptE [Hyphomonadaceae bacterium]
MKQLVLAFLVLSLSACGFTPLYATGGGSGDIAITKIEGRAGQALRKALSQELAPGLPGLDGPATLDITLREQIGRLALRPDESATRTDIVVSANYVLAYEGDGISGRSTAETSFLVPDAPFADIAAQIDATDRAMNILARRIADDLRIKMANAQ